MDGNRDAVSPAQHIRLLRSAWHWWKDAAVRGGNVAATWQLLKILFEFVRDSTPERRRQRYGDAEYDWEYRVNTTSAGVVWRDRLLAFFHSPYQPTESVLFHEMIGAVSARAGFDFREFIFLDLGSGKGRTLLMASDYPFRRIVGVELFPVLNDTARNNICRYQSESQRCFAMESICGDAGEFAFPVEPTVLFLFNPFPERGLRHVMENLEQSLQEHPRPVYVLYHNPVLEHVMGASTALEKIAGTHQYAMYVSR
jgi:hypothetical protein